MSKLWLRCPTCGCHLHGVTTDMIGDIGVCPKCRAEFEIKDESKVQSPTEVQATTNTLDDGSSGGIGTEKLSGQAGESSRRIQPKGPLLICFLLPFIAFGAYLNSFCIIVVFNPGYTFRFSAAGFDSLQAFQNLIRIVFAHVFVVASSLIALNGMAFVVKGIAQMAGFAPGTKGDATNQADVPLAETPVEKVVTGALCLAFYALSWLISFVFWR